MRTMVKRLFLAGTLATTMTCAVQAFGQAANQPLALRRVSLTDLEPLSARQDWGSMGIDKSVEGKRLKIGNREFDRGLGTHANSEIVYELGGAYERFEAWVGVDAEMDSFGKSSVVFQILVDGKEVFNSGVVRNATPARQLNLSVAGVDELRLVVSDGSDNINGDHADWADATLLTSIPVKSELTLPAKFVVRTAGLTVKLSERGEIVGGVLSHKDRRNLTAATQLRGCKLVGNPSSRRLKGGGVEFTKELSGRSASHRSALVERFLPTRNSVHWEIEVQGSGAPWTTEIRTILHWPHADRSRFWAGWGDGQDRNALRIGGWSDPLVPVPLASAQWFYGAEYYTPTQPGIGTCPFRPELWCVPLATIIEPASDIGLSLVLSPEDELLDMALRTASSGQVAIRRIYHRISSARPVRFAMDLVPHVGDWRPGLAWMVERYPQFFNPPNPKADEMAGAGAYSADENPFDVERLRGMGFRVNWKCSMDFPYMGMFLPPVKDAAERWERARDEPDPPGKPSWNSCQRLNDYARWMQENGFFVLSYFNVTEYGRNMRYPAPPRKSTSEADLWKDPHDFLYYTKLADALLFSPDTGNPASPPKPYWTCYGAFVVDAGEPIYQEFMLEQARRYIERIPDAAGLCIDRLDWTRFYNPRRDDGVSWVNDRPSRSLQVSWRDLMSKLGPLIHNASKVIFVNNHTKRLDQLQHVDGLFDEFTYSPFAANTSALLGIRKTVLGWVGGPQEVLADPDAFFQRDMHLSLFRMCPFPTNNHAINPDPKVEPFYADYAPLLSAMRGKKWVLAPHCVEAEGGSAKANLFEVPGGYVVPVTFGGKTLSVKVTLRNVRTLTMRPTAPECLALHPGSAKPMVVRATLRSGRLTMDVPLKRGCAMVKIATNRRA